MKNLTLSDKTLQKILGISSLVFAVGELSNIVLLILFGTYEAWPGIAGLLYPLSGLLFILLSLFGVGLLKESRVCVFLYHRLIDIGSPIAVLLTVLSLDLIGMALISLHPLLLHGTVDAFIVFAYPALELFFFAIFGIFHPVTKERKTSRFSRLLVSLYLIYFLVVALLHSLIAKDAALPWIVFALAVLVLVLSVLAFLVPPIGKIFDFMLTRNFVRPFILVFLCLHTFFLASVAVPLFNCALTEGNLAQVETVYYFMAMLSCLLMHGFMVMPALGRLFMPNQTSK